MGIVFRDSGRPIRGKGERKKAEYSRNIFEREEKNRPTRKGGGSLNLSSEWAPLERKKEVEAVTAGGKKKKRGVVHLPPQMKKGYSSPLLLIQGRGGHSSQFFRALKRREGNKSPYMKEGRTEDLKIHL